MPTFYSIRAHDGAVIRAARFEADGKASGVVQFVHGFGENLEHYADIAKQLAAHGYASVAYDQRGHGRMESLTSRQRRAALGVSPSYNHLLEDLGSVRRDICERYPGIPVILYGHSMGGNVAVNYLLRFSQADHSMVVLESPWFRLYKPINKMAFGAAKAIGMVSPRLTINSRIDLSHLFKNPNRVDYIKNDKTYHSRISFRLVAEITEAGEYAIKNAGEIKTPTLLLCPSQDFVVCPVAMSELAKNSGESVVFKEYEDGYHCLRYDSISDRVMEDILKYIKG